MPESLVNIVLSGLAVVTGGAAWVGRLQTRVSQHERSIQSLQEKWEDHVDDERIAHEKVARIDERTKLMSKNIDRLLDEN